VSVKRILVGASIIGLVGLPASLLAAGVAGADPAPGPALSASGEPLPVDPDNNQRNQDNQPAPAPAPSGGGAPGFQLPQGLANQLNQAAANLPSPVSVDVPLSIGLPSVGLPGLGVSVPLVLGGLAAPSVPSVSVPQLPSLPNPLNLPAPPQLPF
jgi:hypothetical protein